MSAKEVPGFANVLFSLLEVHLLSDGIGLITHRGLLGSDGDWGALWGSGERWRGSYESLP